MSVTLTERIVLIVLTRRHKISLYFHNKYRTSLYQCRRFKERAVRLVSV